MEWYVDYPLGDATSNRFFLIQKFFRSVWVGRWLRRGELFQPPTQLQGYQRQWYILFKRARNISYYFRVRFNFKKSPIGNHPNYSELISNYWKQHPPLTLINVPGSTVHYFPDQSDFRPWNNWFFRLFLWFRRNLKNYVLMPIKTQKLRYVVSTWFDKIFQIRFSTFTLKKEPLGLSRLASVESVGCCTRCIYEWSNYTKKFGKAIRPHRSKV